MTIKLKYLGPRDHIDVPPYGEHIRDQDKEYPTAFANELLETSSRQQFEVVEVKAEKTPQKKADAKGKGEGK